MKALVEEETHDEQKEWISTVVPVRDVPLYLGEGYEPYGYSFMDDGIQKCAIRKRINN